MLLLFVLTAFCIVRVPAPNGSCFVQGNDTACLLGRWEWSDDTQPQDQEVCVNLSLYYSNSLTPLFFSVATPNLPEHYDPAADYMKLGTGKLWRLLFIILALFLHVSVAFSQSISLISNIFGQKMLNSLNYYHHFFSTGRETEALIP